MKILSVMLLICSASFAQQIASYSIENAKSDFTKSCDLGLDRGCELLEKLKNNSIQKKKQKNHLMNISQMLMKHSCMEMLMIHIVMT